jgi:UDP-N-acetylglucosamine 2-epimerase
MEMVEHCLAHTSCQVIATLHPNEHYEKAEIAALERLAKMHQRLTVQSGGMVELLTACDYIVTQNSSVAFNGYFFGKPALLFRKAEFYHIAVQADMDELAQGFAAVAQAEPDYAAYTHWFWQKNSINAGRPEAEDMITARLKRFGWPVV